MDLSLYEGNGDVIQSLYARVGFRDVFHCEDLFHSTSPL